MFRPENRAFNFKEIDECCYNLDEYRDWLVKLGLSLKVSKKRQSWLPGGRVLHENEVQSFFDIKLGQKDRETLRANRRPILLCTTEVHQREPELAFDARLKPWQFYRVLDAYQAFQELDMFLSGVAVNDADAMARISDEDLARAKGFDCYSFKQLPKKGKRKACRN